MGCKHNPAQIEIQNENPEKRQSVLTWFFRFRALKFPPFRPKSAVPLVCFRLLPNAYGGPQILKWRRCFPSFVAIAQLPLPPVKLLVFSIPDFLRRLCGNISTLFPFPLLPLLDISRIREEVSYWGRQQFPLHCEHIVLPGWFG